MPSSAAERRRRAAGSSSAGARGTTTTASGLLSFSVGKKKKKTLSANEKSGKTASKGERSKSKSPKKDSFSFLCRKMRSLLSAARRTGVLGKSNAAHRHPAGFLPTRRMPSVGLGFPIVSSLLEAKTTSSSDRLHDAICRPHRRQQRRLTPQRATAPSAASPASAPSDSNAGETEINGLVVEIERKRSGKVKSDSSS